MFFGLVEEENSPVLVDCKTRDSAAAVGPMVDNFEARQLMEFLELLLMVDYYLRVMRE